MSKCKLRIPIKVDDNRPITADGLRTCCPADLMNAETPETIPDAVIQNMKGKTRNVHFLPEMLSINEAANITNLSYEYLRYLCYQNKINHIRCGRKYMIDSSSLAEFIKRGGVDE